jgi:uncharacterized protein
VVRKRLRLGLAVCLVVAFVSTIGSALAAPPNGPSPDLVISQIYGGGGNTGATHRNDFVEIYNRGTTTVSLADKSVQYASATGTGHFAANSPVALTGSLEPGQYALVQLASGGTAGALLPAPDATGSINMSASSGKVVLVRETSGLACNGGTTPCTPEQAARIIDLIGYGGTTFFETAPAPPGGNPTSLARLGEGCIDTDDNSADFAGRTPTPRNTASARHGCAAPSVVATVPADGSTAPAATDAEITFNEPVTATDSAFALACEPGGAVTFTVTNAPEPTTSFVLDPSADLPEGSTCTVMVEADAVTDATGDHPSGDYAFSFTVGSPARIHDIQGSAHLSTYDGQHVVVPGVVTAVAANGFYLQDPDPDADTATSEGIFVFTSSAPAVALSDAVMVSGLVAEFRPGGASTDNLTTTELTGVTVSPAGPGAAVTPTVVGAGGRVPPGAVIEDDAFGSVESSGVFDPAQDGIDFYESLEGMLLQVNDAVVVGPTSDFGELFVVADDGGNASPRTSRGGIVIAPGDFNPERIQLDDVLAETPEVNVGDSIPGPTVGVLSYDFSNFELLPLTAPVAVSGGIQPETTQVPGPDELSVATFNVENLDPSDEEAIPRLARIVVENLRSPDLIGIEEMQDNTGGTNDGTTAADESWDAFIAAIEDAGGPTYDYRQIDPANNADGGQPGGNIRVGFLFRTDRGLAFIDRPGGDATTPTGVFKAQGRAHLTLSPGRVDPQNPAWTATRKPLAGEFTWKGETVIAIVNHFSSKGGDDPLFGRWQPPIRSTEVARHQQAASVNAFVDDILAVKPNAHVVVLGDINDFEFAETTAILEGDELVSLPRVLPKAERYSYVFEGNSQVLDQILASKKTLEALSEYDVVHVNAEFADQASDHDPSVARLDIDERD